MHKVTLGPSDGKSTVILSGLNIGDSVVTDGTDRLSDGARITVAATPSATEISGFGSAVAGKKDRRRRRVALGADTAVAIDERLPPVHRQAGGDGSLLMIALVLVGLVSVGFLPVSSLPDVDYPTIQVQTFYPGASPQVMSTTVTAPLEVQLGEIPGLQQMTSFSSATASIITLQFDLSLNLDVAEQDVQEAINAANSLLPSGLPAPPTYAKVNPADQPILTLAVTSKSMSLTQLQDIANNRLASKISEVPGVGLRQPVRRQRAGDQGGGGPAEARRLRAEHRRSADVAQRHQR